MHGPSTQCLPRPCRPGPSPAPNILYLIYKNEFSYKFQKPYCDLTNEGSNSIPPPSGCAGGRGSAWNVERPLRFLDSR